MNNITIFGTGYVGLVTGVCLAQLGYNVICVDIDKTKIDTLKKGHTPFYEPGLDDLITKNNSRLDFTTDSFSVLDNADIIFIAVGTPQKKNGAANLFFLKNVVKTIASRIKDGQIIVVKSTVPVGTSDWIYERIKKVNSNNFAVVDNPEFLREGSAIYDFMHPDRVIIGGDNKMALQKIKKLYAPLKTNILITDRKSSEMIKYASNAFLATKISFINSVANLAEKVGADIESIAKGIGLDKRIGPKFLKAGVGFGGSCFPKDVRELIYTSKKLGFDFKLLEIVDEINEAQKLSPIKKLARKMPLKNAKIAVLGLTFKPNTDDIREAPSLVVLKNLVKKGVKVTAWDPISEKSVYAKIPQVVYCPTPYDAIEGADALVIMTEWDELKKLDLKKVRDSMRNPLIIDGRNILDKKVALKLGFDYLGVGR